MKHALHVLTVACLLLFTAFSAGCASYRALQIEPVGKAGAIIVPKFNTAYYYYDRDQNLHFIMRSSTTDKATGKRVDQIATFRVFWRPVGGKTTMENTGLNATYRYVIMTADTVGMYEGAGFVRLYGKNGREKLTARLMDGDLRLTQSSVAFVDNLGRARIHGNFSAYYDDVQALDMLNAAHREFFAHSLMSKPAPPAPPPTETPDDTSPQPRTLIPDLSPFAPPPPDTTPPSTQP